VTSAAQRIALTAPVVHECERGALDLVDAYWAEIRRLTAGLVRVRRRTQGPELRLAGTITLLRFGRPWTSAADGTVECRLAIVGGLLAKEEGGALLLVQRTSPAPELEVAVVDYVPLLSSTRARRSVRRFVYRHVQERAHTAIGRRYLEQMARRAR
jgi:hypothetical protein